MSVTLTNLQTYVRDWLSTSSTRLPDSNLTQIINLSIREIAQSYDLRFMEKETSIALSDGVAGYALPGPAGVDHFSRPILAYLLDPADTTKILPMKQVSYEEFRDHWGIATSETEATPTEFCIFGNSSTAVLVGATPDQSITMYMAYYYVPTDLAAGGDSNDITNYAWEAVLYKALALASRFMLEDDRAVMFDGMFRGAIGRLLIEHGRSRYTAKPFPQMQEPV